MDDPDYKASMERLRKWLLKQADDMEFRETCREAGRSVAEGRTFVKLYRRMRVLVRGVNILPE